jgi:hypothetical protein
LILQLNRLPTAVEQLTRKNIIARTVLSNNKIVLSRFFEQSNFEQMIMTPWELIVLSAFQSQFIVSFVKDTFAKINELKNIKCLTFYSSNRERIMRSNFMRSKFNFFRRSNFWSWDWNSISSWGQICSLIFVSFDQEVDTSIMRSKFKKALLGIWISWLIC